MFEALREKFPHLKSLWDKYFALYKRIEVPAKTILLREGEISKKFFLVEKGCLRACFNNNGKDITFQFFFENEGLSSAESFKKNIPSLFNIEAVEASVVHVLHKKDFEMMMEELGEDPAFLKQMLDIMFERQVHYMKQFLSFIRDTPEQRYQNLVNENPHIIQRIPQHYIASYLGITPVSLSRIRNRKKNKGDSIS